MAQQYGRNKIYARMGTVPLPEGATATPLASKDGFRRQAEGQGESDVEQMLADRAKAEEDSGAIAAGCVAMRPKVEVGGCGSGCGSHGAATEKAGASLRARHAVARVSAETLRLRGP